MDENGSSVTLSAQDDRVLGTSDGKCPAGSSNGAAGEAGDSPIPSVSDRGVNGVEGVEGGSASRCGVRVPSNRLSRRRRGETGTRPVHVLSTGRWPDAKHRPGRPVRACPGRRALADSFARRKRLEQCTSGRSIEPARLRRATERRRRSGITLGEPRRGKTGTLSAALRRRAPRSSTLPICARHSLDSMHAARGRGGNTAAAPGADSETSRPGSSMT